MKRLGSAIAAVIGATMAIVVLGFVAPDRAVASIVPVCPVPLDQIGGNGSLEACVDRGAGATYRAGDPITVCVTANIPMIMIYPPPPAPLIRVVNIGSDGVERLLFEGRYFSGQQCMSGQIAEPFGLETIRAQAIDQNGTVFIEHTVTFTTVSS